MSFSSDWLALREPADEAARDRGLLAALGRWVDGRPLRAHDLGCGTGSTHRAVSPHVPGLRWTLIDNDPALLDEAARRTGAETRRLDLEADPGAAADAEVVTASALFDLVSADWLARFVAALPAGAAIYAALTYDGRESWSPAPPHEAQGLAAFHSHQRGDKGFGPSLGPQAGGALAALLADRGWQVRLADSTWRLGPADRPLIRALADGCASAASETGALSSGDLTRWRDGRRRAERAEIGHIDLLALPRD